MPKYVSFGAIHYQVYNVASNHCRNSVSVRDVGPAGFDPRTSAVYLRFFFLAGRFLEVAAFFLADFCGLDLAGFLRLPPNTVSQFSEYFLVVPLWRIVMS